MAKTRKKYSAEFKLKAVLEILKGEKTASQLSGELEVHPLVLAEWKKRFKESAAQVFEKPRKASKVRAHFTRSNRGNFTLNLLKIKG